jgi:hypothetical protein
VYSTLTCRKCCFGTDSIILSIPDEKYFEKHSTTGTWFDQMIIPSYCGMVAHKQHRQDLLMIHSVISNGPVIREEVHVLPKTVKTIYSVLWCDSHYVAMECNLAKRWIGIYDHSRFP